MDNNINDLLHPSLLQIRYYLELENMGNAWGSVVKIAEKCGVSHGPVSRFFKECINAGYLTDEYAFTERGTMALATYKRILKEVENYLHRIDIPEQEIPEKLRQLVENVDYSLLLTMTRNSEQVRESINHQEEEKEAPYYLEQVLKKGCFAVELALYHMDRACGTRLSMAHEGFEHQAWVKNEEKGSWLELTTKEIRGHSRVNGRELVGGLASLKYENKGQLLEASIVEGKVKIPLDACRFRKTGLGNVKGMVAITVTCSVGKAHMPESTAILMFWM